jgi:tripartite-type tricarboxylate transporter receptor subunit TctC
MQDSKHLRFRRGLLAAALAAVSAAVVPVAHAQGDGWPSKPIRLVVNFPPGSSPDVLARAISLPLQQALGQPVVVDNRAGAGGTLGGDREGGAPDDGSGVLGGAVGREGVKRGV